MSNAPPPFSVADIRSPTFSSALSFFPASVNLDFSSSGESLVDNFTSTMRDRPTVIRSGLLKTIFPATSLFNATSKGDEVALLLGVWLAGDSGVTAQSSFWIIELD